MANQGHKRMLDTGIVVASIFALAIGFFPASALAGPDDAEDAIAASFRPAPDSGYTDIYVDRTVDASRSYVTGVARITGSGGLAESEGFEREVYSNSADVAYGNPKTPEVQAMIDDAYGQTQAFANNRKDNGKSGEIHMSTSETAGDTWDNRTYTNTYSWTNHSAAGEVTYSHTDSGGIDYFKDGTGTYSINERGVTRQFETAGEYGRNTYYRVEASGFIVAYDIAANKTGNGTVTTSSASALKGDSVTVSVQADSGWELDEVRIGTEGPEGQVIGSVYGNSGKTSDSHTFTMPGGDVTASVSFREHEGHGLPPVKTDAAGGPATTIRPASAIPATGDTAPIQGLLLLAACSSLALALAASKATATPPAKTTDNL